jgi:general secretion pathway protein A
MYKEFYELREKPFSLTPDPQYLYLSEGHQAAIESLLYGIHQRAGFMVLAGDIGTGKTTICRAVLDQLDKSVKTAVIFNPFLSEGELLKSILQDFGVSPIKGSKKDHMDALNRFLVQRLSQGENVALIIDEAQNLSTFVLELIRMLSNLETEKEKMIQIVLVGQLELEEKLRSPKLKQLNQRIAIRHRLLPLTGSETEGYIHQRLMVAGARGRIAFSKSALHEIYKFSKGTPRLINLLCDRALMAAFVDQSFHISRKMVKRAKVSLAGEEPAKGFSHFWVLLGRSIRLPISLWMPYFRRKVSTIVSSQESYDFILKKIEDIYLQIANRPDPTILKIEIPEPMKDFAEVPERGLS